MPCGELVFGLAIGSPFFKKGNEMLPAGPPGRAKKLVGSAIPTIELLLMANRHTRIEMEIEILEGGECMGRTTISFHNGGEKNVKQGHNRRDKTAIKNQDHIDRNGHYEIWKDEDIRDSYKKLFDESVKKYNEKQKRADRRKKNYYTEVKKNQQQNVAYEVIISLGNVNNPIDENLSKEILQEYYNNWEKRNPNLYCAGAYYHNDEEGVPHLHVDYIPVGHGYKNGMETRNSLSRGLQEMGFKQKGKLTEQIQWQNREREFIKELCISRNIEVAEPTREKRDHMDIETYKADRKLKELTRQLIDLEEQINSRYKDNVKQNEANQKLKKQKAFFDKKLAQIIEIMDDYDLFFKSEQEMSLDEVIKLKMEKESINDLKTYKAFIESNPSLRKEYQKWKGLGDNSYIR